MWFLREPGAYKQYPKSGENDNHQIIVRKNLGNERIHAFLLIKGKHMIAPFEYPPLVKVLKVPMESTRQ